MSAINAIIRISAVDRASAVFNTAASNMARSMERMKGVGKANLMEGAVSAGAGIAIAATLNPVVEAYKTLEEAQVRFKAALSGRDWDPAVFKKLSDEAKRLGVEFDGSTKDYLQMITEMKKNRMEPESVFQTAEAVALLKTEFGLGFGEMGQFFARAKEGLKVADQDAMRLAGTMFKLRQSGFDPSEMQIFFRIAGGALGGLRGGGGIGEAEKLGVLGNMLLPISSAERSGTAFQRIFNEVTNPESLGKINEELRKLGIEAMVFSDSMGNFKGMDNFVAQFDKLKGLRNDEQFMAIKGLAGPMGEDVKLIRAIANSGVSGFGQAMDNVFGKADLMKFGQDLKQTAAFLAEAAKGTGTNLMAQLGENSSKELKGTYKLVNQIFAGLEKWAAANPTISRIAFGILAIVAALTIMNGVWLISKGAILLSVAQMGMGIVFLRRAFAWAIIESKIFVINLKIASLWMGTARVATVNFARSLWTGMIGGLRAGGISVLAFAGKIYAGFIPAIVSASAATWAFTVALLTNPITWIILGIVALGVAIYAIVKHWDVVKKWLGQFWTWIKSTAGAAWQWIKDMFFKFHPLGIIIKNWGKIKSWFSGIWDSVKSVFSSFTTWVGKFGSRLWEGGKSMVVMIAKGIASVALMPFNALKSIVTKMRGLLPFSPAKEGPFKDLHRVRIVETIADSMKSNAATSAIRKVAMDISSVGMAPRSLNSPVKPSGNSAPVNIQYSPVINISGGTESDRTEFSKELEKHKNQLVRMFEEVMSRKKALSFA